MNHQFGPVGPPQPGGHLGGGGFPPGPPPPMPMAPAGEPEMVPSGLDPGTGAVRTRDLLYRLMVSQLFYDGYQTVAVQLTNLLQAEPACPPSDRYSTVDIRFFNFYYTKGGTWA